MSDDDVLVQGREVTAADLRVESESGNSLALGFALLGVGCWLAGPLRVLTSLPSDLSTATAAAFQPAVPLMAFGFVLVFAGGALAIVQSDPVVAGLERIHDWRTSDPQPLGDGGTDATERTEPRREQRRTLDEGGEDPLSAMGGDDNE